MPKSAADAYLPALPPDLVRPKVNKTKSRDTPAHRQEERPQLGPNRPVPEGARSPGPNSLDESEEEDEYIGPAPPPASLDVKALERAQRIQEVEERVTGPSPSGDGSSGSKTIVRPEWMTQPPPAARTLSQALGEGVLKARGFSTRPSMPATDLDQTEWTETPEEKRTRLLTGKTSGPKAQEDRRGGRDQEAVFESKRAKRHDRDAERTVKSNDQASGRVKSMLEEHQEKLREEKKQRRRDRREGREKAGKERRSSSHREEYVPWDRERDIARLDPKRQRDAVDKIQQLGGRFGHGKRGRFM